MTVLLSVAELSIDDLLQFRFGVDRSAIGVFCQKFNILELGLFGSALRDDFRVGGDDPSDVDLLVTFEPGVRRSNYTWLELENSIQTLFDRKVDICQKKLLKNPYRRAEILKTTQIIYVA